MKRLLSIIIIFFCATLAGAADKIEIPVFVTHAEADGGSGFVNPEAEKQTKEVADSAKDLRGKLKKKKCVRLVESTEDATVVVTVLGRAHIPTGSTVTYAQWGRSGVTTKEKTVPAIFATLAVGDYTLEMSADLGRSQVFGEWKDTAGKLANKIEDWIEANSEKLVAANKDAP